MDKPHIPKRAQPVLKAALEAVGRGALGLMIQVVQREPQRGRAHADALVRTRKGLIYINQFACVLFNVDSAPYVVLGTVDMLIHPSLLLPRQP